LPASQQVQEKSTCPPPGSLLDESLSIAGSTLVDAIVFDDGAAYRVRWTSDDRHTWSLAS
jgi:hypothetical protein